MPSTYHVVTWDSGVLIRNYSSRQQASSAFDSVSPSVSYCQMYELDDSDRNRVRRYVHLEKTPTMTREKTDTRSGEESSWQSR